MRKNSGDRCQGEGQDVHHHTGYPGGLKSISFEKLIDKAPERVIQGRLKACCPAIRWVVPCSEAEGLRRYRTSRMRHSSRKL